MGKYWKENNPTNLRKIKREEKLGRRLLNFYYSVPRYQRHQQMCRKRSKLTQDLNIQCYKVHQYKSLYQSILEKMVIIFPKQPEVKTFPNLLVQVTWCQNLPWKINKDTRQQCLQRYHGRKGLKRRKVSSQYKLVYWLLLCTALNWHDRSELHSKVNQRLW